MFRLKSIYIKDYKNIQDQTFDFSSNTGYIALIGLNGSGKSNLLEAISIIFNDLLDIPHTENVNGYSITFQLNDIEYTHTTVDDTEEHNLIPLNAVNKENLPSSVIACYSGEDLRLWHIAYEEYYMQYFRGAIKNRSFSPKIIYINKYCWKIAFISLLCSTKDTVREFLKKLLSIDDIRSVDIHLEADAEKRARFADHAACRWYDSIKHLQDEDENQLINANVIATTDMTSYGASSSEDPAIIFQFLYLLSLPKKDKDDRQTIDKLITNIKITIDGISFDNLSEGEKKIILIECITQVLGNDNSLVLLDEPDAHVHIAIKKDLLKLAAYFNGQTIITTHSPMFLNKHWDGYDEKNIYYLSNGKIESSKPLKHLSELTDNSIDYFEGAFILSSKRVLVVEGKYDDKYLKKAINIFSKRNSKYKKLNEIVIFSANGASAAEVIYNQIISPCLEKIEKVVFLFDYDDGGWKDGWKKIKAIHDTNPNIIPMFYQDNYSSPAYPTSDAEVTKTNGSKKIKDENSYIVEDLFSEDSYASIIHPVITARKQKDFRKINYGKNGTVGTIKKHIEENYDTFNEIWYNGFEPVLDKLLNVFNF